MEEDDRFSRIDLFQVKESRRKFGDNLRVLFERFAFNDVIKFFRDESRELRSRFVRIWIEIGQGQMIGFSMIS